MMNRRDILRFLGAAALAPMAGSLSAEERWRLGRRLHRQAGLGQAGRALSAEQLVQVRAMAATIIPATDTPGAVEVGAPEFVDLLLAEWYPEGERQRVLAGLDELESRCRTRFGKPLAELGEEERRAFLGTVDGSRGEPGSAEDAYGRVKDGLVYGFITSKPIAELTRTTPIIPGRFDGCVPLRSRP